jgi:hypothetical protein
MKTHVPMNTVIQIQENVLLQIITHPATMEIHAHPMTFAWEEPVPVESKKTAMIKMPAPRTTATL